MGESLFVGRAKEIAQTNEILDDVAAGHGRLLFFVGEPGIGKTRIAQWIERAAIARAFQLGWGRCWETGGAPAFWPWSQVFQALGVPDLLAATAGGAIEARDLRFQQFEQARRALGELAAQTPVVILLDDLHAADVPSLNLLHALARGLRGARVLLVGTYRDAEARIGETGALLSRIARDGEVVALARLGSEDVNAWVRAASPGTADAVGDQVHALTEGNPLFVHELLRVGKLKSLDARRLPEGLRAVLDEHLALVSPATRALLEVSTIFGREASVSDVVAISGEDADVVSAHFRGSCDAGLLEPTAPAEDRYAFAHALLRDRLYADLAPSKRATLHWRAGERLAARGEVASGAHHLLIGCSAGSATRAAEVARDAASNAIARLGFEGGVELASRAIAALEAVGESMSVLGCELEILRAEARIRVGESAIGKADCVRAAALARRAGSPALEARAALAYGAEIVSAEIDPTMVHILRDALESLEKSGEDALRARVMARLAGALGPPATSEVSHEMLRLVRESLALARRLDDPETLLYVSFYATAVLPYRALPDRTSRLYATSSPSPGAWSCRSYISKLAVGGSRTCASAVFGQRRRMRSTNTAASRMSCRAHTTSGDYHSCDRRRCCWTVISKAPSVSAGSRSRSPRAATSDWVFLHGRSTDLDWPSHAANQPRSCPTPSGSSISFGRNRRCRPSRRGCSPSSGGRPRSPI